jgi:hypothetical protein
MGEASKLNRLTHALFETDVRRPEAWVAGSVYMEMQVAPGFHSFGGLFLDMRRRIKENATADSH